MEIWIKNKTLQKSVSGLIIFTMLAPAFIFAFYPKRAEAILGVEDTVEPGPIWAAILVGHTASFSATAASSGTTAIKNVKQWAAEVLKQTLMRIARRLLDRLTQSTVNWINSGFHGSPLFVENTESFFKDIAKSEIKSFIRMTGYDNSRFPFGRQYALDVIDAYQRQFEINAEYTLSKVIQDEAYLDAYRNDFNVGGWNAFLINTQYPQNNYLGYEMLANEELARRLEGTTRSAADTVRDTLQQGLGFLSPETCPSNPTYNNARNAWDRPEFKFNEEYDPPVLEDYGDDVPAFRAAVLEYDDDYDARRAAAYAVWAEENTCPGGLVNTTPGYVAASQITRALGSKFSQAELGAALGNNIAAIFDALLNHFFDKGLTALKSSVNQPPEDDQCDFEYFGEKLEGCEEEEDNTETPPGGTPPENLPASVDLKINGLDGPSVTVPSGSTLTYAWTSTNATICEFSSPFAGGVETSGINNTIPPSHPYYPSPESPKAFSLTCWQKADKTGGNATDTITVNIQQ